jgi:lysophospholipase L1-like esterase
LRRVLLVFVLVALAAACGGSSPTGPGPGQPPPGDQPPPPPAEPVYKLGVTRILTFGDSMTWGVIPPPGLVFTLDAGRAESYPFKLQTLLTARYKTQSVAVYNDGLSGGEVSRERSRFTDGLRASSPELVLLMEGANDLNSFVDQAGTNALVDNLVGMMEDLVRDAVERRGVPVFLATLPPQRPPKGRAASLLGRYNNGLKTMAAKKGATLVDVGAQIPASMIGADGLHPTEEGYQRIAEIFYEAIKAKYESVSTPVSAGS